MGCDTRARDGEKVKGENQEDPPSGAISLEEADGVSKSVSKELEHDRSVDVSKLCFLKAHDSGASVSNKITDNLATSGVVEAPDVLIEDGTVVLTH